MSDQEQKDQAWIVGSDEHTEIPLCQSVASYNDLPKQLPSFWQAFQEIVGIAGPMALSFSFSFSIPATIAIRNSLRQDPDFQAATVLIATLMNALPILAVAHSLYINNYVSERIGQLEAAKRENNNHNIQRLNREMSTVIRSGTMVTLPIATILFLPLYYAQSLVELLGQHPAVAREVEVFTRPYAPTVFGLAFRMLCEQPMLSFGKAWDAAKIGFVNFAMATLSAALLSIVGQYGPQAIALSYMIESFVTAIVYALYISCHSELRKYRLLDFTQPWRGTATQICHLLRNGLPITASFAIEVMINLIISLLAGLVATTEQAALNLSVQFLSLIFVGSAAFGATGSMLTSRKLGERETVVRQLTEVSQSGQQKYQIAHLYSQYGLATTFSILLPFSLLLATLGLAYPPSIGLITHTHNARVQALAANLLPIFCVVALLDAGRYYLVQVGRAYDRQWPSIARSAMGLGMGMALAAGLGLGTELGVYGIALGHLSGEVLAFSILLCQLPNWQRSVTTESTVRSVSWAWSELCSGCLFSSNMVRASSELDDS